MISPQGDGSRLGAGRLACHIREMADTDKTKEAMPKPGGKTGAAKDAAENATPQPDAPKPDPPHPEPTRPDPTRYGDWEINGRCVDF